MNLQTLKKLVPSHFHETSRELLLKCLAWRYLPTRGYRQYSDIKRTVEKDEKQLLEIQIHPEQSIFIRLNTTDIKIFEQIFLIQDCTPGKITQPKVIFDLGAHIGCSALYYHLLYPDAQIIAVEAAPTNFEILARNVKNINNITAVNAAIWHETGFVQIVNLDEDEGWNFRMEASQEDSLSNIQALTVSDLMSQQNIDHIDLVKIDIEGAEKDLFEHDRLWLNATSNLVVELHDGFMPGCSESLDSALEGYRFSSSLNTFNRVIRNLHVDTAS